MSLHLILVITLITLASSCQEHCTKYEIVVHPSSEDNCTCSITLNQLINKFILAMGSTTYLENMEIVFQTGIHRQTEIIGCWPLLIERTNMLIIKGQPNVTVDCLGTMTLHVDRVTTLIIQNMHFQNCTCFQGFGIVFETLYLSTVMVTIVDSNFTNSRLILNWRDESIKPLANQTIMISNSVFEDCCSLNPNNMPILFMNHSSGILNFTMQKIDVHNNRSPFLLIVESNCNISSSSAMLTGKNYFTNNANFIINVVSLCANFKLLFSQTEVFLTNNTIDLHSTGGSRTQNNSRSDNNDFDMITKIIISHRDFSSLNTLYIEGMDTLPEKEKVNSPIMMLGVKIHFTHSYAIFSNNGERFDAVIHAQDSDIILHDDVHLSFINNTGENGGAISLDSYSRIIFNASISNISLYFVNNTAHKGGAIYVEDGEESFLYEFPDGRIKIMKIKSVFDLECSVSLVRLTFQGNLAQYGGNSIYGGWVDWTVKNGLTTHSASTINKILTFIERDDASDDVASDPIRICLCEKGQPNCNITDYSIDIYGYVAHLNLVAVGQRYTPVLAYARSNNYGFSNKRLMSPSVLLLKKHCTNVTYKIYSDKRPFLFKPYYQNVPYNNIQIQIENGTNDSATINAKLLFKDLSIKFKAKPCPLGFSLHKIERNCVCQERLLTFGFICDSVTGKIHRTVKQWISIAHEHVNSVSKDAPVIAHQSCPLGYCKTDGGSLSFNLEDRDELCASNRSGILCGGCKTNFSRALGSSGCKICSNNYGILSIIALWMVTGVVLVYFLMCLNLTVSVGTINEFILYCNIIHTPYSTFFTSDTSSSFIRKLIAWPSLDQAFELCLVDGLDTYAVIWLQFLFPLYLCTVAVILIIVHHYSTKFSRFIGSNAIPVLATLILIIYAKLLYLIIQVFSFTTILYPDGYKSTVWLADGNIEFLRGKHIPLFLVTLILLFLSLTYTIMLLVIQVCRVARASTLKPLFDAYTEPYKANHRYWTGLMLVIRVILFTVFSLNQSDNPTINLLAVTLVSISLLMLLYFTGQVYNRLLNNCLQVFFLSNLAITSIARLYQLSTKRYSSAVVYTSTGLAFVIFFGVIIYHAQQQLYSTQAGKKN